MFYEYGPWFIKRLDNVTHRGDYNHVVLHLARIQTTSHTHLTQNTSNCTKNTVHPASVTKH